MTATGYLEQPTGARPLSFGGVLLLHGAAIAAVLLIKGTTYERVPDPPIKTTHIELDQPPPPEPPPVQEKLQTETPPISVVDAPPQVIPTPVPSLPVYAERTVTPPGPVIGSNPAPSDAVVIQPRLIVPPQRPIPNPVRVEAQWDPRFAGAMQPPYPAVEQRNEREGSVRLRVTIGTDGRVVAVSKLSATSDAFWRATERQALSRWRFKPATVDGKPVQSSKVLSVTFRLDS